MIVLFHILCEMGNNVLYAVSRFGIEKIKGVVGGGQVTIHTVGYKPLGVIHMGGVFQVL